MIEREVEFQHIDAWLAEQPELSPFGVSRDESPDLILRQAAFMRDPGHLETGRA
jgi:hypothetical protein